MAKLICKMVLTVVTLQLYLEGQVMPTYQREAEENAERAGYLYPYHGVNSYYRGWKEDDFLEKQYEDSLWPSRRDDELSDQLSR